MLGSSNIRRCAPFCAALALAAGGCASEQQVHDAISAVNRAFRADYERVLADKGTRTFEVRRAEAFVALRAAMSRLGMRLVQQDPDLGYLNADASAPRPLSAEDWRRAAEADLPRMREIAAQHVGIVAQFISFEPEGLEVVINGTTVEVSRGTEVSLTMRLREVAPPKSGMPRREYPPPTAVRLGLDRIWAEFEQVLAARKGP